MPSRQPGGGLAGGGSWPAASRGRLLTSKSNTLREGGEEAGWARPAHNSKQATLCKQSIPTGTPEHSSTAEPCVATTPSLQAHLPTAGPARSGRTPNSRWKVSRPRAWCCIRMASRTCRLSSRCSIGSMAPTTAAACAGRRWQAGAQQAQGRPAALGLHRATMHEAALRVRSGATYSPHTRGQPTTHGPTLQLGGLLLDAAVPHGFEGALGKVHRRLQQAPRLLHLDACSREQALGSTQLWPAPVGAQSRAIRGKGAGSAQRPAK